MGGGIGQWLLFRAGDRSLTLFALVVPPGLADAGPRPPRLGARRPLPRHAGRGDLRGRPDRAARAPVARARRLLRAAAARRRHPPREDDLGRDVRLDPPAHQRHGLRLAARLRRRSGAVTPFRSGYVNVICDDRLRVARLPRGVHCQRECATLDPPGYRHEALFYRGDEEFLAGTVPLVRDAVDADSAVLVAVPRARARALREALGGDGGRVASPIWSSSARNPAPIIGAWRDFVREHAGGDAPPLGIGEPIWPARSRSRARRVPAPRDAAEPRLPAATAVEAAVPLRRGAARARGPRGRPPQPPAPARARRDAPQRRLRPCDPGAEPLPEPPADTEPALRHGDLSTVREFLAERAGRAGFEGERLADLVLAVHELADQQLRYARGQGTLRTWRDNGSLLVEVARRGAHRRSAGRPRLPRPRRDRRPRAVPGQPALRPRAAALLARRQRRARAHAYPRGLTLRERASG